MGQAAVVIPEKIYFKIGEVCELVGVQAHVLRYWETEFPMLAPQKNRSGQRSYRRKDVEMALRVKELLYDDMFTIAGAKKKLQAEIREGTKLKVVPPLAKDTPNYPMPIDSPSLFDEELQIDDLPAARDDGEDSTLSPARREAIRTLATHLLELREMLRSSKYSSR